MVTDMPDNTAKSKKEWTLLLESAASASDLYLTQLEWLQELGNTSTNKLYLLFWHNLDENKGFRITQMACELLMSKGYKHWTFHVQPETIGTGKILLLLDHKINAPWHLLRNALTVFDQDLAIAMSLTQGDVVQAINLTG
jgi:hypothetical protein